MVYPPGALVREEPGRAEDVAARLVVLGDGREQAERRRAVVNHSGPGPGRASGAVLALPVLAQRQAD